MYKFFFVLDLYLIDINVFVFGLYMIRELEKIEVEGDNIYLFIVLYMLVRSIKMDSGILL